MEAEKNKISTDTLTYEDIHNKAEYEAGSTGVNIDTGKDAEDSEAGVTPNIGVPAEDKAESDTKATIAEGEIEIRDKDKQKQDLKNLNRDTRNSLNKLGEIFDKESIQERQELAGLFGELAYKAVGDMAVKNGWEEGSAEKNALHALVGGIMSELTGSGFLAGASGAMVNEMIQDKLSDMFKDDPAMHQWASALIGGVVSEIVTGNAQSGASTAASATKNNILSHEQEEQHDEDVSEIAKDRNSAGEIKEKQDYWAKVDKEQQEQLRNKLNDPAYVERLEAALKENPDITEFEGVVIKGKDLYGNVIDATNPINRELIAHGTNAFVKNIVENGVTGLPSNIVDTIDKGSGSIQNLKGTPIYNSLKAMGIAVDVVLVGNVIYTDIEQFEGMDVAIAIVYDITGQMVGTLGGAAVGIVTGNYTRNPFAIGAGTIAGAAVGNAIGSRWADQRKENLKKTGVNNNEK